MVEPRGEEGGDTVCWLGQLCPGCGAMPSADSPDRCWRCGARFDTDPTADRAEGA